jgi:hypothetical protein
MAEPTPECEACGELLTAEDLRDAGGVALCPECYSDTAPLWAPWRWREPEAGEARRDG